VPASEGSSALTCLDGLSGIDLMRDVGARAVIKKSSRAMTFVTR